MSVRTSCLKQPEERTAAKTTMHPKKYEIDFIVLITVGAMLAFGGKLQKK